MKSRSLIVGALLTLMGCGPSLPPTYYHYKGGQTSTVPASLHDLRFTYASAAEVSSALSYQTQLRFLMLINSDITPDALIKLGAQSSLRMLEIEGTMLTMQHANAICSNTNLTSVWLVSLRDLDVNIIKQIAAIPSLKTLGIADCPDITETTLTELKGKFPTKEFILDRKVIGRSW